MDDDYSWDMDWGAAAQPTFAGSFNIGQAGSGYNQYRISPEADLNLSPSDPASAYYQPPYNPASGIDPRTLPQGGGLYSVGDNAWNSLYAPGGGSSSFSPEAYQPASYAQPPAGQTYTSMLEQQKEQASAALMSLLPQGASSGGGFTGGGTQAGGGSRPSSGGGSSSSYTPQPYQRIQLGAPERTLYDRYSSLLQNPEGMSLDPAYKFLFNQGMQAFNRSAAAKRMRGAGNSAAGATSFGQGLGYDYMNKMLPQYQAGAQEELRRFMGPAGLLPQYTGANNQVTSKEGSDAASKDLLPYYQRMLEQGMGGGSQPTGASWGGLTERPAYTQPRLQAGMALGGSPSYSPPPFDWLAFNEGDYGQNF